MPDPKMFSAVEAAGEAFQIDPAVPGNVIAYRFGRRNVADDWLSPLRRATGGGFPQPLNWNEIALLQTSYGSKAETAAGNSFLSIATDHASLFNNGEVWVQNIIRETPDLGQFSIPFAAVRRPRPTKLISKQETEWLFYDGNNPLLNYLVAWLANPY
jgi:hypothetical protein